MYKLGLKKIIKFGLRKKFSKNHAKNNGSVMNSGKNKKTEKLTLKRLAFVMKNI
ncbi:MAG: hypothetical protein N3723_00190 [Candidatus Phytoplasma australiense]|nr:hypothetical protein [Candidatus Phytoplasma australiense]